MAVKILIKRRLPMDKDKVQYIVSIFRQLRMLALEQEGYISSETLRSMENPQEFLVISAWRSLRIGRSGLAAVKERSFTQRSICC